VLGNSTTKII
jgi:hypothetical protein